MRARLSVISLAVIGLFIGIAPAGPRITSPPSAPPDSHTQPLADGCPRTNAVITLTLPEWVYVNRSQVLAARAAGDSRAGRVTLDGTVASIHAAGQDQFTTHDYNDVHIAVALDPTFANYAATGNPRGSAGRRHLDTEWEEAQVPMWAWPQVDDRVREYGRWIWDCGHWGNGPADPTPGKLGEFVPYDPAETIPDLLEPGTIRGEKTELHPMDQLTTWRNSAAGFLKGQRRATELKRLDVWINGDSTPALQAEECALYGIPPAAILTAGPLCPRYTDVGGTYRYTIDVGPKPKPNSKLVVNDVIVHPETDRSLRGLPVRLSAHPKRHAVDVSFTLPHRTDPPVKYGITVEAGWTGARKAVHHVVTVDKMLVRATLDGPTEPNIHYGTREGPEQTPDPGEWVMFFAVNGHWHQVSPTMKSRQGHRFNQLSAADDFRNVARFDYWLPEGVAPTIYASGRECDIPLLDCRKDFYGAPPTDYTDPFTEVGLPDKPGRIALGFLPLPLAPGTHNYSPAVNPSADDSDEQLSDHICGGPCYTLTITAR